MRRQYFRDIDITLLRYNDCRRRFLMRASRPATQSSGKICFSIFLFFIFKKKPEFPEKTQK